MAERYNGYENYETWALCLELDNDQYLHEEAMRVAKEAYLANGGKETELRQITEDLRRYQIFYKRRMQGN